MRTSIKRFAPVKFHWSVITLFLLIPVVTLVTHGMCWDILLYRLSVASILYLSFILHELGHLTAGLLCGYRTYRISVYVHTSVSAMFRHVGDLSSSVKIALAGPAASFAAAAVALVLDRYGIPYSAESFYINFAIGAFNLIPAYPLDAGRILKSVLSKTTTNPSWASKTAIKISFTIAILIAVIAAVNFSAPILFADLVLMSSAWSSMLRHRRIWERI